MIVQDMAYIFMDDVSRQNNSMPFAVSQSRCKTRPAHTAILPGARRRQKKEGEAEEDMAKYIKKKTWKRWVSVSWHGARRIASDRDRWRLLVARCSRESKKVIKMQAASIWESWYETLLNDNMFFLSAFYERRRQISKKKNRKKHA